MGNLACGILGCPPTASQKQVETGKTFAIANALLSYHRTQGDNPHAIPDVIQGWHKKEISTPLNSPPGKGQPKFGTLLGAFA